MKVARYGRILEGASLTDTDHQFYYYESEPSAVKWPGEISAITGYGQETVFIEHVLVKSTQVGDG